MPCVPLTDEDKATLCLFVATAHFRTQKSRDHWKRQWGQLGELGDQIKAHVESLSPEQRANLENATPLVSGPAFSLEDIRPLADQPLRLLPLFTTREAELLSCMTITILCTSGGFPFITSDAPVVWFDPELYKMPSFYRNLALGSPTIEVSMPISPTRSVLFTHGRSTDGYFYVSSGIKLGLDLIDESNRKTRFHCDDHFVSDSKEKKDIWFDPGTPPPGWK